MEHPDRSSPSSPALDRLFLDFRSALAGRYALERELGRGGMGIVYLAHDERLERPVAIKLLPPALAAQVDLRGRLLGEARIAARLSHPNIIPIHAVEEVREFAYFVMAYVEGETLARRIAARGALSPSEVGRILREVAWGLAYAHARGVVHRDVKPENILLEAATGRALVADFGIARVWQGAGGRGAGAVGTREVVGTPAFMSPEQAAGEAVDGRGDLYSLGVVAFYALSGALPFTGPSPRGVMARQVTERAPPLLSVAPRVPPALAAAVERCLAKDPEERFVSGEALVEAVEAALAAAKRLPMALRAFLADARRGTALRLGAAWIAALGVAEAGLWLLALGAFPGRPPRGVEIQLVVAAAVLAAAAVVALVAVLVARARRVVVAGHGRADLLRTLQDDLDERREELAYLHGGGPTRVERAVRRTVVIALGLMAAAGVLAFFVRYPAVLAVFTVFGACGATAVVAALLARELAARRTAWREERRLRFWRGPMGRVVFRLTGSSPPGPLPLTGEGGRALKTGRRDNG
ncbi:MAG: serine/threonine-protein kinase [Gemmatimonadales bacterium]